MNLIIKRGVEYGEPFLKFFDADDCEIENRGTLSDNITGVDAKDRHGIFENNQRGAIKQTVSLTFRHGVMEKKFEFPIIDFYHDDILTIEKLVQERVKTLKDWVAGIDWTEELEFSVGD